MTPALAQMAAPSGFSRHGHIYVPSARTRAELAWFSREAEQRRIRAGGGSGSPGHSMRCSPGFFGGAYGAMFTGGSAEPSYDPWLSNGQSDVLHYSGANCDELYLLGVPASGNVVGSIAGNILTPVTSPLYQQPLYGAHLGAGFDVATTDSFDGDYHNVSTGSLAKLVVMYATVDPVATVSSIVGRRGSTTGYVLQLYGATPRYYWLCRGSAITICDPSQAITLNTCQYVFVYRGAGIAAIIGSEIADYSVVDISVNISNANAYAIGSVGANPAGGVTVGVDIVWTGADADIAYANRAGLSTWWAEALAA